MEEMDLFYKGPPLSWVSNSVLNPLEELSLINPMYAFDVDYRDNCVNCVVACELRFRGYDVCAKSRKECNVGKKPKSLWKNVESITYESINDLLGEINTDYDKRYFIGLNFVSGDGHALMMVIQDYTIHFIDAQLGKEVSLDTIQKFKLKIIECWRIDNLEITQSGYNACKERR